MGFAGVFTVVLQGYQAVGATQAQAASGLFAVSLVQGLATIFLSRKYRIPVSIAWSTPGSVLLAATGMLPGGFAVAVGAFMICALLIVLTGLVKPLAALVAKIPAVIASAMLAGILLNLCLAPAKAVATEPFLALPVILVWAITFRFARIYAVPAAVACAVVVFLVTTPLGGEQGAQALSFVPSIALVAPQFSFEALISIAIPLFVVTMASQNIPGIAVMKAYGYEPPVGPVFVTTGIGSLLTAPLGGHTINFAAITAAISANPEAHPDPSRRWIAAVTAGIGYVVFAFLATPAALLVATSPPVLIQAATGLALFGAFGGSLSQALAVPEHREAAVVTFVTSASGISFFGIGPAFWGLVAGGAFMLLNTKIRATKTQKENK